MSLRVYCPIQYPDTTPYAFGIVRVRDNLTYDFTAQDFVSNATDTFNDIGYGTGLLSNFLTSQLSNTPRSVFTDGEYLVIFFTKLGNDYIFFGCGVASMKSGDDQFTESSVGVLLMSR